MQGIIMRFLINVIVLETFICGVANAEVKPKWVQKTGLAAPESVLADEGILFVSNISGEPTKKDGTGWIAKLNPDGTWMNEQWVKGLNAPKGMGVFGDSLWVSDIDELVEISKESGSVKRKIAVKDAQFLNDITVSKDGVIYVSDIKTSRIHKFANEKLSVFLDPRQLAHPNGLWSEGNKLFIVNWGLKMDETFATKAPGHLAVYNMKKGKMKLISDALGHLDGLVRTKNKTWIISDWMAGKVFKIGPKDKHASLLISGLKSAADLGLSKDDVLYVPDMVDSKVYAYDLAEMK